MPEGFTAYFDSNCESCDEIRSCFPRLHNSLGKVERKALLQRLRLKGL